MEGAVVEAVGADLWSSPRWYRALSIAERLAAGIVDEENVHCPRGEPGERVLRRVQEWKGQVPFDRDTLFEQRLALDALSEADLVRLVAEPDDHLQSRYGDIPEWLLALRETFCDSAFNAEIISVIQQVEVDHPLAHALPAVSPLLGRGLEALQRTIESLRERYLTLPFETDTLPSIFVAEIAHDLLYRLSKPLILEMHIARLKGDLHGETAETRFDDFMRQLVEQRRILPILEKYPVLARQLLIAVDQWAAYLGECLEHLCADRDCLIDTLSPQADPGPVVRIRAGLGDRHRRGRHVVLMQFRSGLQVLHKPKSLAVDMHFQDLLEWLNAHGADPCFKPLRLIDRGEYGWSEFAAAAPCRSADEVVRFYLRQGGFLAILYALGGVDLHNENLIAAGEHPMFIDLEALFHPHVHGGDQFLTGNPAANAMDQSVWQVGLLPRRIWSDAGSPGVDTSGLGGQAGQMLPHALARWQDMKTDEMRLGRERVEMPVSENRPRLEDADVDVLAYRDALIGGFTRTYRLLCSHRDALLDEALSRFEHDEIRAVIRSTNVYGTLHYESYHPDLLRDAIERDRFLDRLWIEIPERPYLTRVLDAERRDLLRGDIPLFTTFPNSRAVVDSEGRRIEDFFDTTSLELVRRRIAGMGEEDLVKQVWIIEASLATLLMDREDATGKPIEFPAAPEQPTSEGLLERAIAIGDRLDQLALRNEVGAYWMGVGPLDEMHWGLFPTGTDLYSGTSGIALFLAYLGAVTGDSRHTDLAKHAMASLELQIEDADRYGVQSTAGAFDGLGSLIYLFTHLGILWHNPAYLSRAQEFVMQLPPVIDADDHLDVIYGSVGCLLALLALHTVKPSEGMMEMAVRCGNRLINTAIPMTQGIGWITLNDQPPLGGFSHGAAGAAMALLKLAGITGESRFRTAALQALEFDRSLFVPEFNNWQDVRVFPHRGGNVGSISSMVAWCHGAPGIGLARLGTLGELDDDLVRREIDIALDTTFDHGFVSNHSLCHGALGNVELLLTASRILGRPRDRERLDGAISRVIGSMEMNGPVTGVPLGVDTPGLMTGLTGIGYQLLRLARPDVVPSVLLLDAPGFPAQSM